MFDIHTHSTHSDGTDTPAELVAKARAVGLSLFALTDHDSLRGIPEAARAASEIGLPFLAGCELEAEYEDTLHILGIGLDIENEALKALIREKDRCRNERNRRLTEKLLHLGVDVVPALPEPELLTRGHFADALVELGYAKDRFDAFDRFIGSGAPAFVKAEQPSPEEVVGIIRAAGGTAIIAHPMKMKKCDPTELIRDMARLGIEGVEAHYCGATEGETRRFASIARENGLFVSCGSDCHGLRRPSSPIGGAWRDCEELKQTERLLIERYF